MVEFQTKLYFKIWTLVVKYIESPCDLELWNYDFLPKTILAGILATYGSTRVGPIYEKFSDQALNWSKVVPWHEKQSEAIIFQLS